MTHIIYISIDLRMNRFNNVRDIEEKRNSVKTLYPRNSSTALKLHTKVELNYTRYAKFLIIALYRIINLFFSSKVHFWKRNFWRFEIGNTQNPPNAMLPFEGKPKKHEQLMKSLNHRLILMRWICKLHTQEIEILSLISLHNLYFEIKIPNQRVNLLQLPLILI